MQKERKFVNKCIREKRAAAEDTHDLSAGKIFGNLYGLQSPILVGGGGGGRFEEARV